LSATVTIKAIYDPYKELSNSELGEIHSLVKYRKKNDETRVRLTKDNEILLWMIERRVKVIAIGKGLMARFNDLYWYHNGIYEPCNGKIEQWLQLRAKEFDKFLPAFSTGLKQSVIEEVVNRLKREYLTDMDEVYNDEHEYLAFKNGLLSFKKFFSGGPIEVLLFNPDIKLLRRIPHNLLVRDEEPRMGIEKDLCPKLYSHFVTTVGEEWATLNFEIIGYCLTPGYPLHTFFVLHGPHDTGKGTFSHIVHAVLGKENVSAKTFNQLAEQQFELQHLYRMFANIGDEMPRGVRNYVETIKALTGESPINAPKKHSNEHFTFMNEAKCIFIGNELPRVGESNDAFWDRVEVIPYKHRFKENKDYETALLIDEKEISGLLYCSLVAVRPVLQITQELSVPDRTAKEEWRMDSDTVRAFIIESVEEGKYVLDKTVRIEQEVIHPSYVAHIGQGKTPVGLKGFTRRLKEQFGIGTDQVMVDGKRVRYYVGIGRPKNGLDDAFS